MVAHNSFIASDAKLKDLTISDDIVRTAMVWSCLSFPATKSYTVEDIYNYCLDSITERGLAFQINREQIGDIISAAFCLGTVVCRHSPDRKIIDYSIVLDNGGFKH